MTYYRYTDPLLYCECSYSNELNLEEYEVIKETPCGVWIKYPEWNRWDSKKLNEHGFPIYIQGKKFILEKYWHEHITIKRFAWPTKELALISYIARKERQIRLLEGQLEYTKIYLEIAKNTKIN